MIESRAVHDACARLRFAEGLRRRWQEARAEAALQEAANLATLEGVRLPVEVLREVVSGAGPEVTDPQQAQAVGIWSATWEVEKELAPLNTAGSRPGPPRPAPFILAGINRAVCSYLVAGELVSPALVAMPSKPSVLAEVAALTRDPGEGLGQIARVWRLIATSSLFPVGNGPTAVIFTKWLLARSGIEPTGVAILSQWLVENVSTYRVLVTTQHSGDQEWQQMLSQCLIDGCAVGEGIAKSIQAGHYPQIH